MKTLIRPFSLLSFIIVYSTTGFARSFDPISQIRRDYSALTRRVTARHILLPSNSHEACLALKQKIRNKASEAFIVDVFAQAAIKYSRDEATNARGGLIGELLPQGYCRPPKLDRECFRAPLGVVKGPLKTEYGCHLLLVTERTNCPKLDGDKTKVVQKEGSHETVLVSSEQVGQVDGQFLLGQLGFWIVAFFAGGIVAEVVASLTESMV